MKKKLFIIVAIATALFHAAAFADDDAAEVAVLKQEVKALEARLAELEKREQARQQQQTQAAQPVASSPPLASANAAASPNSAAASDAGLAQRVAIIERNQEIEQENEQVKAAQTPTVEMGSKGGLIISNPDKQYSVNLHGYVQADDRTFLDGGAKDGTDDTFLIRSARPIIDAKMTDYFNARIMMDFGRGQTTLLDAYGDFHPMPGNDLINLRAGEFKVPIGIERWQSESDVLFVERSQTTNLVPYRDVGVMTYGQLIPDQIEYELALLNGAADLQANTGTDNDNKKDVAGRIFTHPLLWSGIHDLEGLGVGVAGTYGIHQGNTAIASSNGLAAGYVTVGQRTEFAYASGVVADGPQWRLNPEAMYYNGPFSLITEYVLNSQEVEHSTHVATFENKAWEVSSTYVLTGEDASFDGVQPAHNFDPKSGNWGAFELVGRLSQLNVDRQAFTNSNFAVLSSYSREAFEHTIGGTWYFNPAVKLNLDFSYTTFEGGAADNLDHEAERAIMTRTQVRF